MIGRLFKECDEILVIAEGQPLVERQLRGLLDGGKKIYGKLSGEVVRTGELDPDNVRAAIVKVKGEIDSLRPQEVKAASQIVMPRPYLLPVLCPVKHGI